MVKWPAQDGALVCTGNRGLYVEAIGFVSLFRDASAV